MISWNFPPFLSGKTGEYGHKMGSEKNVTVTEITDRFSKQRFLTSVFD